MSNEEAGRSGRSPHSGTCFFNRGVIDRSNFRAKKKAGRTCLWEIDYLGLPESSVIAASLLISAAISKTRLISQNQNISIITPPREP